ncbi:phosphonoacetaldehyde phosphonohydrolase-related protein [Pseudomonas fulva]|nr:phosphonoacetaldehyde phosphonohydrolase-related protein [Pseudomonas fulva]MBF8781126.1 phosphonoacetaldehyde phosphonohydrolase-related protein [Pseudomonas fulva]
MPDATNLTAVLFGLRGCLVRPHDGEPSLAPGALDSLGALHRQQVPCIWIDELDSAEAARLAAMLPDWLPGQALQAPSWPAPDACWQALMSLGSPRLEGCVLVSGEPRQLLSGLNAGLWTVGLATCSPACDLASLGWQSMSQQDRDLLRSKATLALFDLGVHSVIDHLEDLDTCLADISRRRQKGEKP